MAKRPRRPKTPQGDQQHSSETPPDYAIGYGRPPGHGRFKPGRSGNPEGRPKKRLNLRTVMEQALNQTVELQEGDRTRSISKLEGVINTMLNKALRGDAKVLTSLIALLRAVGITAERPEPSFTEPVTVDDADIIDDFLHRQQALRENAAPDVKVDNRPNPPSDKGATS
jgi:hypothetical protein